MIPCLRNIHNNIIPTKLYTPCFLSLIQANEPFHALNLFQSLIDSDPDTNAKGIYLTPSKKGREKQKTG